MFTSRTPEEPEVETKGSAAIWTMWTGRTPVLAETKNPCSNSYLAFTAKFGRSRIWVIDGIMRLYRTGVSAPSTAIEEGSGFQNGFGETMPAMVAVKSAMTMSSRGFCALRHDSASRGP